MSNPSPSEAGPKARALRERLDLSLVAEGAASNRAHSKSAIEGLSNRARAHSKSAIDGVPNLSRAHSKSAVEDGPVLSGADRVRAEELARRLASTHSG